MDKNKRPYLCCYLWLDADTDTQPRTCHRAVFAETFSDVFFWESDYFIVYMRPPHPFHCYNDAAKNRGQFHVNSQGSFIELCVYL